jgi:hypothetical protein
VLKEYTPQIGDAVSWKMHGSKRFFVVRVDARKQMVDLRATSSHGMIHLGNVEWSEISKLDAGLAGSIAVTEAKKPPKAIHYSK